MSKIAIIAGYNNSWTSLFLAEKLRLSGKKPSLIIIAYPFNKKRIINIIKNRGLSSIKNYIMKESTPYDKELLVKEEMLSLNITSPSIKKWAKKNSVEIVNTSDINSFKSIYSLKKLNPDITLYSGGGIIKKDLIQAANNKILNAHSGQMPFTRGMSAMEWSLLLDKPPGVTIHYIDTGIDTGEILGFEKVDISKKGETLDSLRQKIVIKGCKNLVKFSLKHLSNEKIERTKKPKIGKQCFIVSDALQEIAKLKLKNLIKLENT